MMAAMSVIVILLIIAVLGFQGFILLILTAGDVHGRPPTSSPNFAYRL